MKPFKIATWNVNSIRVRLPQVLRWLESTHPDVLALQELKSITEDFPLQEFERAGYKAIVSGQKTYNGVAILSKHISHDIPIDVITDFHEFKDEQRRILVATIGGVRCVNLYIPNGESVTSSKYQYKLTWLNHLTNFLQQELVKHPNMIVLGDFNIAPAEIDVYSPVALQSQVLFSGPERAAFQAILKVGLQDCFRLFDQPVESYSWWDYRLNAFKRNMGLRIDHILASKALIGQCRHCVIDKVPRTWERPSDHAPVIAEFIV